MREETTVLERSYRAKYRISNAYALLPIHCDSLLKVLRKITEHSTGPEPSSSKNSNGKRRLDVTESSTKRRKIKSSPVVLQTAQDREDEVPVYLHRFRFRYSKANSKDVTIWYHHEDDNSATSKKMLEAEMALLNFLKECCIDAAEPTSIDIGEVDVTPAENCLIVHAQGQSSAWGRDTLLTAPAILDDPEAFGYAKGPAENLFGWLNLTKNSSLASIRGQLRIVVQPPAQWDVTFARLPFELHLDVTLLFRVPSIFRPIEIKAQSDNARENARQNIIRFALPPAVLEEPLASSFSGRIDIPFFYSAIQPAPSVDPKVLVAAQPRALNPTLLPFQKRSTIWLLAREGKAIDSTGAVSAREMDAAELPLFWERVVITRDNGEQLVWYYRRLTGTLTPEFPEEQAPAPGGILAEEPGLGKTLECISLILLNPGVGRNPSNSRFDSVAKVDVKDVKTTLIITPGSLSQQWADELALHAPTLKVLVYEGWQKLPAAINKASTKQAKGKAKATPVPKRKARNGKDKAVQEWLMDVDNEPPEDEPEFQDWWSYVNTFDVCITTYNVLKQDLHVARAPPVRPRREVAEYSQRRAPRSPLIQCEWYRVIMDEVQMVGGGKTQEMVSLIPRVSSFAVSGTPAKLHVADLSHVLKFLRVDPMIYSSAIWRRLQLPAFARDFVALFQRYTIRTTKASVRDELTIPVQTRYLVPIELGRVEQHVYDENIENALRELGLDARGVAASENWQMDATLLRSWLLKLRQICTHPQVGQLLKQGERTSKGALKTMSQVLEGMYDQNWRNLMEERRTKVNELARYAQIVQHEEAKEDRYERALKILLDAEKEVDQLIQEINTALEQHAEKGEVLKKEAAALREARAHDVQDDRETGDSSRKGKGKAVEEKENTPASEGMDEDGDIPKTPAGEEHIAKKRGMQARLRECYVSRHRIKFLQGDVYHVMGETKSAEEDTAYAAAEDLRRQLLKITEQSAMRAMTQLDRDIQNGRFALDDILVKVPYCEQGGIRSADLMAEADEIIEERMNEQSRLLWKWRAHIYGLLTQKLNAGENEADGQEYARTLATQGEAEVYLQAYAALMADRREILTAERTALANHEHKVKKFRNTKAAVKAAAAVDDEVEIPEDVDINPEHEVLHKTLAEERRAILEDFEGRALKSVVVDLNAAAAKCMRENDTEKVLAKEGALTLRKLISEQGAVNERLEADLALFRKAFNERILYFRQLQEISDSVVAAEWEGNLENAIEECKATQTELDTNIKTRRARQRYLEHLAKNQSDGDDPEEDACILCRCDFLRGYITHCAHVFCEDCMKSWLSRQGSKACPVCRVPINVDTLQRFSIADKAKDGERSIPSMPSRLNGSEPVPKSRRQIEYNIISSGLFDDIQSTESLGSYGSKIQTLVRHLLYLQMTDPGAKSIVFSAWADSLHIIEHALTSNGIPCLRIDQAKGKQSAATRFRTDPDLLVLLLHGERENAGLNVTCASRVFLLESVVHHTFEIQAIARIDRMGQSRPTEVYCYYAEDTVEKNILDLAARQGHSLYTRENAQGTLNVTPLAPDSERNVVDAPAKKKQQKGDFIFKTDDMMAILFPHLFEDIEYLVPAPDADDRISSPIPDPPSPPHQQASMSTSTSTAGRGRYVNAVAGPSRI
ncbi:hypothetical protein DENSPDRAFT_831779 [Dentipellis sp. KUC8613]|nr:hypothetical protein DENSPDRAFT_831779 [Dentipellis sp. KUC8613]